MKTRHPIEQTCPCGSGKPLAQCCEPLLGGARSAPTAEALMRSRYTAYALAREDYLLASWHHTTRPQALAFDEAPQPRWIGLQVKRHEARGDDAAIVEFVARYKVDGRAHRMHEVSRFVREDGRWFYVDAEADAGT